MRNLYFANTTIKDGFWKYYSDLVRRVTVRAVYDRFFETGRVDAERRPATDRLYSLRSSERVPFTARLIPYFTFANREECDMIIWTQVR